MCEIIINISRLSSFIVKLRSIALEISGKRDGKPIMAASNSVNNKICFVKDIKDNQVVKGLFLVKEMNKSETRAGKPFLTLNLMDKTGEIVGRVWDNAEQLESECS